MGESEPTCGEIPIGGEMVLITRDNMTIYRHLGANALFDHCFIEAPNGENGVFVWRHNPDFDSLSSWGDEHKVRTVMNLKKPSDRDYETYIRHTTQDLETTKTVPSQWIEEFDN